MLLLLDTYPGSRGAIIRQRFQQLKKTVATTLWKMLPKDHIARMNHNEGFIYLTNGSRLDLLHLDKAESINNLKSLDLNFAYVDQAEDVGAEAWDVLWERLGRWSGATKRGGWPKDWPYKTRMGECIPPRYLWGGCYSPGFDHWITARFWEYGTERERYREQGYKVFHGSSRDNLALSQEYLDSRLDMGDEYVRRFVDAVDWGAREGRIFDLKPQSILTPTKQLLYRIKNTMKLHRAFDYGEAAPWACLWYATDDNQNVFVYREAGAPDMLVSEQRQVIFDLSLEDGDPPKYYSNVADPSIFNKTRGRTVDAVPTWSVRDEFVERKLIDPKTAIVWQKANNNESMTCNRLREYLRQDPKHRHPLTGTIGAPRIYFLRKTDDYPHGCKEVITDIQAARRVEVGTAPDGSKLFGDERDDTIRDHWLDACRYAIGARPSPGPHAPDPEPEPGVIRMDSYMKQMEDEAKRKSADERRTYTGYFGRGGYGYG